MILRFLLIAGCAVSAVAVLQGALASSVNVEPALARLLRGMALIKGAAVLGVAAVVGWRFGWPLTPRIALVYLVATWVLAASTAFIWQLTHIVAAALFFHAALIAILVTGWRFDPMREA